MKEVFNFSAGPAMLPKEVMLKAQAEFTNWRDLGCSVMEVSHRGKDFIEIAAKAEQDLRDLLSVPSNYHVLFTHGGGRGQIATLPLKLSNPNDTRLHLVSGDCPNEPVTEANNYNKALVGGRVAEIDGTQ